MTNKEIENFIRQKAAEHVPETNEKISWSLHALKKLRTERLRKKEIEDCPKECIIVEDYASIRQAAPVLPYTCFCRFYSRSFSNRCWQGF